MSEQGVRWQKPLKGTLHLSRTNGFFLGGGKNLVNTYYDTAERLGVRVVYDASVIGLERRGRTVESVVYEGAGTPARVRCGAVVVAAGGWVTVKVFGT